MDVARRHQRLDTAVRRHSLGLNSGLDPMTKDGDRSGRF